MKKIILPLAFILAPWIPHSALAQGRGEADAAGAKSPPRPQFSAAERKAAALQRKQANSASTQAGGVSRGGHGDTPENQKR